MENTQTLAVLGLVIAVASLIITLGQALGGVHNPISLLPWLVVGQVIIVLALIGLLLRRFF